MSDGLTEQTQAESVRIVPTSAEIISLRHALMKAEKEVELVRSAFNHEVKALREALSDAEAALSQLLSGTYGFVGHVDACRVQIGETCTCGFAWIHEGRADREHRESVVDLFMQAKEDGLV